MGLCPSRNHAKNLPSAGKSYEPLPPAPASPPRAKLRADAAPFLPMQAPAAPEPQPWERFLADKEAELERRKHGAPFARRADGTYTSAYRTLLAEQRKPTRHKLRPGGPAGATGAVDEAVLRAWADCAPVKPKPKQRAPDPLKDSRRKAGLSKEEALAELAAARPADDSARRERGVPFGLTDRHWSGEDGTQSHVHCSRKPAPQRPYVRSEVTPELEEAMAEVLYKLRLLRSLEAPELPRRYCVGLQEVHRASLAKKLQAVLVAVDVEAEFSGKLEVLLATCRAAKTPVVFGLSRLRLGQAVKKGGTVSVLGVLDVRGAQAPFARMLELA